MWNATSSPSSLLEQWHPAKGPDFTWGDGVKLVALPDGFQITSVYCYDFDGQPVRRVPTKDAYEIVMAVEGCLVPNVEHVSYTKAKDCIHNYLINIAAAGLRGPTPKAIETGWAPSAKNFPRTVLFSRVQFSGLELHKTKNPGQFVCLICDQIYNQLASFLFPKLDRRHDWKTDPEITLTYPNITFQGKPLVFDEYGDVGQLTMAKWNEMQNQYNAQQSAKVEKLCP